MDSTAGRARDGGEGRSSASFLAMVEDLLALEDKNISGGLGASERDRWHELTMMIFGPAASEKRRFFRVSTQRPAKVLSPEVDDAAQVLSLSGGGLFLQTAVCPDVGEEMEVTVSFPIESSLDISCRAEVRWAAPVRGDDGPGGVGLCFVDLDEERRRAVLEMLRDHLLGNVESTLGRYRLFFLLSPDITFLVDHASRVVDCNGPAAALLRERGLGPGAELLELAGAESRLALVGAVATARESGRAARCDVEIPAVGALQAMPLEVVVSPVSTNEIDLGTLVVGRDQSARRQIEAQRRELERRLYQADKLASLGQIAAGIAHDINNPLAWILSNLSLLEGYVDPLGALVSEALERDRPLPRGVDGAVLKEMAESLPSVVTECADGVRRISAIIGDLKVFSKVEGAAEDEVDVNEALETSLRMVLNQIDQRAHVRREYGDLPRTWASFGKLSQVFLNLLSNASRSFPERDVERNRITLRTWAEKGVIKISVADNGKGIPAELQQRVFEPFFTTVADGEGTGLGLTIARDAAAALQGEIELSSVEGEGTSFVVTLPVRPAPASPQEEAVSVPSPYPSRRFSLLIVDDEEVLLRAFARQLRRRFDVTTASSGPEALERYAESPADVILCDVMIPGMSGTSLLAELESRYPGVGRKVVFMTGGTFGDAEQALLASLPNPVLEKPFDVRKLERLLKEIVTAEE